MVKCEPCSQGKCKNKYHNRHMCKDPENCTCSCQETAGDGFWKGFGSIALGAAAFAGGVVLTVSTGGLGAVGIAAVVGGGALTGVGATAAIHPIAKQMNGERMTGLEYVTDLAIGGTVGAITGPIGAGGASATTSIASKVGTEGIKQGAVKFGCRTAVGAVSGATASVIQEVASDREFSMMNVVKGAGLGAATGGVGHVTSTISNQVSSGVAQSVTKVVTDTAGTAVVDAGYQLIFDGEVDGKKLAFNVGARAATSAGYEAVATATINVQHGGKEMLREKMGDKEILDKLDPADKEAVLRAKESVDNMPREDLQKEVNKAARRSEAKKYTRQNNAQKETQKAINNIKDLRAQTVQDSSLSQQEKVNRIQELNNQETKLKPVLEKQKVSVAKLKDFLSSNKATHVGDQHVHTLDMEHIGQIAADIPDGNSNRGLKRVVFDVKIDNESNVRTKIAGIITDHDYKKIPGHNQVKLPELSLIEPFVMPKEDDDEDKKKKD